MFQLLIITLFLPVTFIACAQLKVSQYLPNMSLFPSCSASVFCASLTSCGCCLCRDEGCRGGASRPQGGFEVQARRRRTWPGTLRGARHGPGRRGRGHDAPGRWYHQRRGIQPRAGQRQRAGEAAAAAEQQPEPVWSAADPETEAAPDALHPGAAQRAGEELRQNALSRYLHAGGTGAEDRSDGVQSAGRTAGAVFFDTAGKKGQNSEADRRRNEPFARRSCYLKSTAAAAHTSATTENKINLLNK